jgi:hypothetical protein
MENGIIKSCRNCSVYFVAHTKAVLDHKNMDSDEDKLLEIACILMRVNMEKLLRFFDDDYDEQIAKLPPKNYSDDIFDGRYDYNETDFYRQFGDLGCNEEPLEDLLDRLREIFDGLGVETASFTAISGVFLKRRIAEIETEEKASAN